MYKRQVKTKNDAAIGIIFTAMFSIGVMGISYLNQSQGAHLDLSDFLFGNVLGVSNEDMYLTGLIMLYTLGSIIVFYRFLFITTFQPTIATAMGFSTKTMHYFFMLLLSVAVVSSLRTVGVILVVAMLITPAATALLLSDNLKRVIVISSLLGLASAITGFFIAVIFGTTPGPAMTIVATCFYILAAIFSPSKGILFKELDKRRRMEKIVEEDILRQLIREKESSFSKRYLADHLGISKSKIASGISRLLQTGLIKSVNKEVSLSENGILAANRLVRAHRLWETYQVNRMGIDAEQIHEAVSYTHLTLPTTSRV